ncbi:uncharacterized protein LOC125498749 [Beta vulgaris subsp. vulgaris]|uniref:uncharacterized protein LOC125498749 n=1 Tax=Beta vulgaris subsp. vulgaris TaxID=3555 RepID=UPI002036A258|nr:uncharacterized protein LOC125498749 [Beta vulgaris subsp. vulgaris]
MGKKTLGNGNAAKRRGLRSSLGLGDGAKVSEVTGAKVPEVTGTSHTDEHIGEQDRRSDPGVSEGTNVGKMIVIREVPKVMKRVRDASLNQTLLSMKKKKISSVPQENTLNPFRTNCCGKRLCELNEAFTSEQKKAVTEIGFGSLLHLKITRTNNALSAWLVDRFDGGSGMFKVGYGKEFKVNQYDVYDVFQFPMVEGQDVLDVSRGPNADNPHFDLKASWREYFKVDREKGQIGLSAVYSELKKLVDGGEVFKKLYVLFAFSSFLAPVTNNTLDLRLVLAVHEVQKIPHYNWCKYILGRLMYANVLFKNSMWSNGTK